MDYLQFHDTTTISNWVFLSENYHCHCFEVKIFLELDPCKYAQLGFQRPYGSLPVFDNSTTEHTSNTTFILAAFRCPITSVARLELTSIQCPEKTYKKLSFWLL